MDPTATSGATRRGIPWLAAIFTGILLVAAGLLLYRLGSVSRTWDEAIDTNIVSCLGHSHNPFHCLEDITQTRLPMYLHAAVKAVTPASSAQYGLSAAFALVNVVLVFLFTRARFGVRAGLFAMALMATSPPLLASGRMLMSHSNVMLTTFTLVAVMTLDRFGRSESYRYFWLSAVAFGLTLASSVLGVFTLLVLAPLWAFNTRRRRAWDPLVYLVVAGMVFLLSTIIYVRPTNLGALIQGSLGSHTYPEWNYLQLGTSLAPRWYSPLLFLVKIGPWWVVVFAITPLVLRRGPVDRETHRSALIIWGASLTVLFLKSAVFRYDAPHQQVPWYPFVFILVAATADELLHRAPRAQTVLLCTLAAFLSIQLYDAVRFFPNYLFYGAQYGDRFIGEFYGPAVMHKQDLGSTDKKIDAILAAEPDVRILTADHSVFDRPDSHFVPFTRRDLSCIYEFALVDRVYSTNLRFPERDEYNAFLKKYYTVVWSHYFPTHEWAYRVLQLKPEYSVSPSTKPCVGDVLEPPARGHDRPR